VTFVVVASVTIVIGLIVGMLVVSVRQRSLLRQIQQADRRRGEQETAVADARQAARRLEQALHAMPQGVVVADAGGAVVYRNDVAGAFADARHSDALVEAAIGELVAGALDGRAASRELDLYGPPRRSLVISARPLPSAAGLGAIAVIEDATERRRLEAVRRDFVANISHELKTPVGALSLLAETLLAEDDPHVTQRLAERIVTESFRVGRTIEDLLELSRIESGELPRREPVPVNLVVAEAIERIRPAAEQAGIDLEVREPNRRLAVFGDRRQLVSAIYNLLDNAVKYSDAGSAVEVFATTDGQEVEIGVRDHGIGIPAGDLERVFERFYRVDQARSRQTGGTGLGLAIVRHVMQNHDGSVHVESRPGEGSTFTLCLPTASGPVAVEPPDVARAG
jgi:two-component system sensor histidine kinase SenX3